MFCGNCGSEMSENERFCSQCGWRKPEESAAPVAETPVQPEPIPAVQETPETTAAETPVQPEPAPVAPETTAAETPVQPEPVPVTPAAEVQAQPQPVPAAQAALVTPAPAVPNPATISPVPPVQPAGEKGKSKAGLVLGIIGGVAVLLILILALNAASITNFCKKTFSSPEKYYQWVEKETADDAVTFAASIYGSYIREAFHAYDTSMQGGIKIELGEAGQEMLSLAGLSGVDLSWFESAAISYDSSVKDNVTGCNMSVQLGKDELLSLAAVMDLKGETVYVQIPELTKTYMGVETGDMEESIEAMELLKLLYENTPDKAKVEKLLGKYAEIALSCIEDVEKDKKTIRAEGITQECTRLIVTVDDDTLEKMVEQVAEAMAEDEELKKIIVKAVDALKDTDMDIDMDGDEVYEEFVISLEDMAENADDYVDSDMEFVMEVYVDSKGNIRGRSFEFDGVTIEIMMPHNGNNFGYKAVAESYYGEKIAITGTGKDSGGTISGEFSLEYNGTALADINVKKLDTDKLVKGQLEASFTVEPSSSLVRAMDMSSVASVVDGLQAEVNVNAGADSAKIVCTVSKDEELWGTITMSAERESGKKVTIPADKNVVILDDEEDFEDWYDTVNWDSYLKKLDKSDLPSEIVDALEDIADMDVEDLMRTLNYIY